jgi:hypothetical protein
MILTLRESLLILAVPGFIPHRGLHPGSKQPAAAAKGAKFYSTPRCNANNRDEFRVKIRPQNGPKLRFNFNALQAPNRNLRG